MYNVEHGILMTEQYVNKGEKQVQIWSISLALRPETGGEVKLLASKVGSLAALKLTSYILFI